MIAYDALSFNKSLPRHRMLWSAEAREKAPGLNRDGLVGAALYYDAQVEFAERLVVENVLSAQSHGCIVRTYAPVRQFIVEKNEVVGVEGTDLRNNQSFSVRGSVTINAAGPWVDDVSGELRLQRMIGGTKGSHIVVARFTGAPETALYVEAKADQRPFFIIPWNGNYLIGTTDKRFDANLDSVEIDDTEIEYLLSETNHVIPQARLKRNSILFAYSGVRPLPFGDDHNEAGITRRHFIHDHAPAFKNLFSIVGGKLTTYRSLSEQVVDLIFRTLSRDVTPCLTAKEHLPGAANADLKTLRNTLQADNRLSATTIDHLVRVYGTRVNELLQIAENDPNLLDVFDSETGAIAAEVVFAFQKEFAQTLGDCLLRRTMVGLNSRAGIGADKAAAEIARRHLAWSEQRASDEVKAYRDYRRLEFNL
jgi:glycerol-3-phosphate dehydrogenase